MDWFLFDSGLRHERVKYIFLKKTKSEKQRFLEVNRKLLTLLKLFDILRNLNSN